MPDRRIKGRPLTDLLDAASKLEQLEQQKRELDAQIAQYRSQGENLRALRQEAGMSLGDLASSLGTSKSYISQVENGVRGTSSDQLMRFTNTISSSSDIGASYGYTSGGVSGSWMMNFGVDAEEVQHGNTGEGHTTEEDAVPAKATSKKAGRS